MKAYLREDTYVEDWPEINFEGEYAAEVDPRTKILGMIDNGTIDCCNLAKDLLAWLPNDWVDEFMRVYNLSEGLEENPEEVEAVEESCKGAKYTEGKTVKECSNGYKKPLHEETAAQAKTLQAIIKMIDSKYIDDITATLKKAADDAANLSADDIETWVYDGVIGFVAPYFEKYHQLPIFKDGTVFVNEDADDVRDLDYDTFASQYSSTFDFLDLADDYIWFNNEFKNDYEDDYEDGDFEHDYEYDDEGYTKFKGDYEDENLDMAFKHGNAFNLIEDPTKVVVQYILKNRPAKYEPYRQFLVDPEHPDEGYSYEEIFDDFDSAWERIGELDEI